MFMPSHVNAAIYQSDSRFPIKDLHNSEFYVNKATFLSLILFIMGITVAGSDYDVVELTSYLGRFRITDGPGQSMENAEGSTERGKRLRRRFHGCYKKTDTVMIDNYRSG